MYRYRGLGAGIPKAERERLLAEERAAELRRIAEAEAQQRAAAEEAGEFRGKVLTWLPRVGIAVAVVVGAFAWWRLRKKG